MLEDNYDGVELLRHYCWPLPILRNAAAGVLPADVEEDWACLALEGIVDHPVSLLPVLLMMVVTVVGDLIEPVLLLVERSRRGVFVAEDAIVFGIIPGEYNQE